MQDLVADVGGYNAALGHVFGQRSGDGTRSGADVEEGQIWLFGGLVDEYGQEVGGAVFGIAPFVVLGCFWFVA